MAVCRKPKFATPPMKSPVWKRRRAGSQPYNNPRHKNNTSGTELIHIVPDLRRIPTSISPTMCRHCDMNKFPLVPNNKIKIFTHFDPNTQAQAHKKNTQNKPDTHLHRGLTHIALRARHGQPASLSITRGPRWPGGVCYFQTCLADLAAMHARLCGRVCV